MPVTRTASCVMCVLAVSFAGPLWAEPVVKRKTPQAPVLANTLSTRRLQASIVAGRVSVVAARFGSSRSTSASGGRSERIETSNHGGNLALSYELSSPGERLTVELSGRDQVRIRWTPRGDNRLPPVEFQQTAEGPLSLTVGPPENQQLYQADDLWRLMISRPKVCREHLAPLLELLGERWDLVKTAGEVEEALLRRAEVGKLPEPTRWAELVEQLGDDRFSRREAADRELRKIAPAVICFLKRLDPEKLDAEQHLRIRRIILSSPGQVDTPEQVAARLAGEPKIWLVLLGREKESTRRHVLKQLEALLGQPIRFDPAADKPTREIQLEKLRAQVGT